MKLSKFIRQLQNISDGTLSDPEVHIVAANMGEGDDTHAMLTKISEYKSVVLLGAEAMLCGTEEPREFDGEKCID